MPTYDYVCAACGHELELFQSMTEAPKRKCPACGALKLRRQIGAGAGVLFKGSGFYQTDYRSDSYRKAEKGDSAAAEAKDTPAPSEAKGAESKSSESKSSEPKPTPAKPAAKPSTKGAARRKPE